MATNKISLDTGSTIHTGTYVITESALQVNIPRSVLNDSAGVEKGIAANPLYIIPSGGVLSVSNVVAITGSVTILGVVAVTGSTAVVNTVAITGSTEVLNIVTVTGSTAVVNVVSVTGSTAVVNTVAITGSTTVAGVVTITGSTTILNPTGVGTSGLRFVESNDVGRTLLSTTGTLSATNGTLVISAASQKIKVYAISLTTTSSTQQIAKFQSAIGSGDLWTIGLIAPAGAFAGANLAVTPPAYLFAAPTATILNLNLASANATQFSISYFLEA